MRVDELSSNMQESLSKHLQTYRFYSLALDESTYVSYISQLAIFVHAVFNKFEITVTFCSMKGTTRG